MKNKTTVLTAIVVAIVVVVVLVGGFMIYRRYSYARMMFDSHSSASGPGFGPGMMNSGQAPGELVAVSANGEQIVPDPASELPENTAAQKVGGLNVSMALSPYPPTGFQESNFAVTLTDEQGQAVTDAKISLDLTMPEMWMPPNKLEAQHAGNGQYLATGRFTMRGLWRIEVILERGGNKQSAFFDVSL
jgi:hypothetical protein